MEEGNPNSLRGLSKETCRKYQKELLDTVQNSTKISIVIFNDEDIEEIPIGDNKFVLAIHVKEADRFHKPVYLNGSLSQSYVRNGEGDFLLRQNQITSYLCDSSMDGFDSLPNSADYTADDITLSTFKEYRKLLDEFVSPNFFHDLSDEEVLRKTSMIIKNKDGKEVLTNAGVILFTSAPLIERLFPHYLLDYQRKDSPGLKWDDRIVTGHPNWSGNAFDFYLMTLKALSPYIPSAYVGEENRNNGPHLMYDAVKEMIVNALCNHAFLLDGSLSILRLPTSLVVTNNGKMLVSAEQALIGGRSNPRNLSMMSAFRRIGASDRAGTGVPKIELALEKNGFPSLSFEESSYPFESTTATVSFISLANSRVSSKLNNLVALLASCQAPLSSGGLMELTGWSRTTVVNLLKEGIQRGIIKDNGKEKKAKKYFLAQ